MESPKAQWDVAATKVFSEYATKQVSLGNRPTKFFTPAHYNRLAEEFNAKTERNYEKKKFKNRWDDMKAIYSAWVFYKKSQLDLDGMMRKKPLHQTWAKLIKVCCFHT